MHFSGNNWPNIVLLRLWWCAARLGNPGSATTSAARNPRSTISIYTEGTILLGVLMCNFALFDDSFFLRVISVPTLIGDWLTVVLVTVVVVVLCRHDAGGMRVLPQVHQPLPPNSIKHTQHHQGLFTVYVHRFGYQETGGFLLHFSWYLPRAFLQR